ncbi:MAG: M1 family aminopeptidase [Bacteroidota bacterium]
MKYPATNTGIFLLVISLTLPFHGCKTSKSSSRQPEKKFELDYTQSEEVPEPSPEYHGSVKRINDIQHMRLEIDFDWQRINLNGKATLLVKPCFKPVSVLNLQAKNFEIREVAMLSGNLKTKLKYLYDNKQLSIDLGRNFKPTESYTLFIDYVAHPHPVQGRGNEVQANKGMYFIVPEKGSPSKQRQIWTEGETSYNSCWFPTIDSPNERFTQEIAITIDKELTTLSNGILVWQQMNADSTRTDIWKQNIPSPPYLTMIAAGNFSITYDKWRDKEVAYYTDLPYARYAKNIFGKTPEMMEFFSKKTGVDYPWEKYAQVVVQGHLVGAMENTSATVFGDFIQQLPRELADENNEEYIAHELFHQWFGNLVTCESWANLTLNEGFASYGEYLWYEYKYGKQKADEHLRKFQNDYLDELRYKNEKLIRYQYAEEEELFDAHSYQKGALVIHMLRSYLGDDVFFAGINQYLEKNKFSPVELQHLRLAMEEVSGEDLNWFFNQWFLKPGLPEINFSYSYNDSLQKLFIHADQACASDADAFILPLSIDIHTKGKKESSLYLLKKKSEVLQIALAEKPDWVDLDPEKSLLIKKTEEKPLAEWIYQYNKSSWYNGRLEALNSLTGWMDESMVTETFMKAFSDAAPGIREFCITQVPALSRYADNRVKQQLLRLALKDESNYIRGKALESLGENYNSEDLLDTYQNLLDDASPLVVSKSLMNIYYVDKKMGLAFARTFLTDSSLQVIKSVASVLSHTGDDSDNAYFIKNYKRFSGKDKYAFAGMYSTFLLHRHDSIINRAIPLFEDIAVSQNLWYIRLAGTNALHQLAEMYSSRQKETRDKIAMLKNANTSSGQLVQLEKLAIQADEQISRITAIIHEIKSREKDANLIEIYKQN